MASIYRSLTSNLQISYVSISRQKRGQWSIYSNQLFSMSVLLSFCRVAAGKFFYLNIIMYRGSMMKLAGEIIDVVLFFLVL